MKKTIKILTPILALLAVMLLPTAANACAVCMGASDSSVAPAANGAIFFMIGLIGTIMACVCGFIIHLARLAK